MFLNHLRKINELNGQEYRKNNKIGCSGVNSYIITIYFHLCENRLNRMILITFVLVFESMG